MNSDLDFIKGFSKITITKACKKANVDRSNLIMGRIKDKEKIKKVKKILEREINNLYKEEKYEK